ncbi:MAG: hypothetical protein JO354_14535 [Verrucomicrobia bacterium]|nr:hypothetical protein [Verrucomicrobiota bacterium]
MNELRVLRKYLAGFHRLGRCGNAHLHTSTGRAKALLLAHPHPVLTRDHRPVRRILPAKATLFLGCYLLFCTLIISRRVDCIRIPQFWAEEGSHFFADAVMRPFWVNIASYSYGYFDLLLRLTAELAAVVPVLYAPVVFVLVATGLQAAVPTFIISHRCAVWLGPFWLRFLAALLYCGLPNSFEVHCICLHSRVHLAVLASLLIVSPAPTSRAGRLFDSACLLLAALSGPFVLLLAPAAAWRYWRARTRDARRTFLLLIAPFALCLFAVLNSAGERTQAPLGASLPNLVRVVGGQFTMGMFLGEKTYAQLLTSSYLTPVAWLGFVSLLVLIAVLSWYSTLEVRLLLCIGAGAFALALASPLGSATISQWRALWSIAGSGQRYYFLPMSMLLMALVAQVANKETVKSIRLITVGLLVLIAVVGVRVDWILPAFTDLHFAHYATAYRSLPPGSSITIPINPPGWSMKLVKPAR